MPEPKDVNRREVEQIMSEQKLKPAVIKGTTIIRFVKKPSPKYDYINIDQMYKILDEQHLGIRASGSYLMVYKKDKK